MKTKTNVKAGAAYYENALLLGLIGIICAGR